MSMNENLPPNVIRQLSKELKNLDEAPPEGIKIVINDDDITTILADIEGPAETPYENGIFRMKLLLSREFPHSPPKGYFITKIFHPNIATNGEICVNTLKKDWNPSLGLRHVLVVVRCLLIEPFPESALNEQAGKMLLENYEEYARHARLYTSIHALKPKPNVKTVAVVLESTTASHVDKTKLISNSTMPLTDNQLAAPPASNRPATNGQTPLLNPLTGGQSGSAEVAPKEMVETSVGLPLMKKELRSVKPPQIDKKKIDARKKALKRL